MKMVMRRNIFPMINFVISAETFSAIKIPYIRYMKKSLAALSFILPLSLAAQEQRATPQLLKEPANWEFERFALPPAFAPGLPFKGAEELRFSPGMFKKDSTEYFTYAFVAELENTASISQNDIRNYLLNYFKGLCSATARDRKLVVDTSKITVATERKKSGTDQDTVYNTLLNVFGVFADGAPIKLNMEVKVLMNSAAKKTYLFFIASPHEKNHDVWKGLYALQKKFIVPG
jgi:hypothetical protein